VYALDGSKPEVLQSEEFLGVVTGRVLEKLQSVEFGLEGFFTLFLSLGLGLRRSIASAPPSAALGD
jgi:hypothetical protein